MKEPLADVLKTARQAIVELVRQWQGPLTVDPYTVVEQIDMHLRALGQTGGVSEGIDRDRLYAFQHGVFPLGKVMP